MLDKLAQMMGQPSMAAPQLVAPPPGVGATTLPTQVPFGGARPPMQSPDNMINREPLKTPAVEMLLRRGRK